MLLRFHRLLLFGLFPTLILSQKSRIRDRHQAWMENPDEIDVLVQFKDKRAINGAKYQAIFTNPNTYNFGRKDIMRTVVDQETLENLAKDKSLKVELNHAVHALAPREVMEENLRKLAETTPWGVPVVLQDQNFFNAKVNEGGSIKICVADTGYDLGHPDLFSSSNDVTGTDAYGESWGSDGNGHGTHCSGVVAAIGGNNQGVVGVIPNNQGNKFQLIIGKALNNEGSGTLDGVLRAVENCIKQGATVISMSLGCDDCYSSIEEDFYQDIWDDGILLIAAAGNSGQFSSVVGYPAGYKSVVAVASLTASLQRSDFSSYFDQVEISGPGTDVFSTYPRDKGSYKYLSGTSMACPHVAAVAGLIWRHFLNCKNVQVRNVLDYTAKEITGQGCQMYTGYGLVQAKDAYDLLSNNCGGNIGNDYAVGGCNQLTETPGGCETNSDCDDNDSCTNDICKDGKCFYEQMTCSTCGKKTFTLEIQNDQYFQDVTWNVKKGGQQILSGNAGTEAYGKYIGNFCLDPGSYLFTILDAYGDGICCYFGDGYYKLYVMGTLVGEGDGQHGKEDSVQFSFGDNVTPAPTPAPVACNGGVVILELLTDRYPGDTSWEITQGSTVVESGGDYKGSESSYEEEMCLPIGSYSFSIFDSYGDGICCMHGEGEYKLIVDNKIVKEGGDFSGKESTSFVIVGQTSPSPTPSPLFESPVTTPTPGCKPFNLELETDKHGDQTIVSLVSEDSNVIFMDGPYQNSKTYEKSVCLENGKYFFTIFDARGDGICCTRGKGEYTLTLKGSLIQSGSKFDFYETTEINVGETKDCKEKKESCSKNEECCSKKCKKKKNSCK